MFPGNPHRLQLPVENKMPSATVPYLPFPFFFFGGGGGGGGGGEAGESTATRRLGLVLSKTSI